MRTARALIAGLATVAVAACSGGGSDGSQGGTTTTVSPAAPAASDVATTDGTKLADFKGDATAGEGVFGQCRSCHAVEEGQNRVGPSLYRVVGSAAGHVASYTYSPAMKTSGITWSRDKLFQFLENPRRVVPGTKMVFAGIGDPQKRADVIEYLATR